VFPGAWQGKQTNGKGDIKMSEIDGARIAERHNKELGELYKKAMEDVSDKVDEYNKSLKDETDRTRTTSPLFLKSHEGYENAETKIMIFGKETNGWGENQHETLEEIRQKYVDFFINEDGSNEYCRRHRRYHSHFWIGIKEIINLLNEKNAGKKIGSLWNNIVKMGYSVKGFPDKFYKPIVKPYLNNLITKEIEILKPDYIIFLTGPGYDWVLNDVFGTPERKTVEGFSNRQLCEIIIPNVKRAFRTYHPNYFSYEKHIESKIKDRIFNKITEEII
jgi:hypothetical protein